MNHFEHLDFSRLETSADALFQYMERILLKEEIFTEKDSFDTDMWGELRVRSMEDHYKRVFALERIFEHNDEGKTFYRLVFGILECTGLWAYNDSALQEKFQRFDEPAGDDYSFAIGWLIQRIAEATPHSTPLARLLVYEVLMELVRLICLHNPKAEGGDLALYYYKISLAKEGRSVLSELLRLGQLIYLVETSSRDAQMGKDDCLRMIYLHNPLQLARIDWSGDKKRRDSLEKGIRYAALAYRHNATKANADPIASFSFSSGGLMKGINGRFHFDVLNLNGYVGIPQTPGRKKIILAYSGTEFRWQINQMNWFTNITQGLLGPTIVYRVAAGLLQDLFRHQSTSKILKSFHIEVYGHSLGGGLMQYAVSQLDISNVRGYGYNSASLSWINYFCKNRWKNISHLYLPNDVIFKITGVQLGRAVMMDSMVASSIQAHKIEKMQELSAYPQNYARLL